MIFGKSISEIEKGCEKEMRIVQLEGDKQLVFRCGEEELCPTCQAKLSILTQVKDVIEKEDIISYLNDTDNILPEDYSETELIEGFIKRLNLALFGDET